jgi:uncharacterized protein (DUF1778 family)
MGTTMTGFVRAAAEEKAQSLIDRETRLTLSGATSLPSRAHSMAPSPPTQS